MTVGNINRGKMYFLTHSHSVHEVKMKRGEPGSTYYSAGPRRSRRVNKLHAFRIGLDVVCNMKAAAHQIGVNLIKKKDTRRSDTSTSSEG